MSDISLDRAAAPRPLPKPGILEIAAYVPGKSKVEGIEHPLKLSANENILGSSEHAREAFAGAFDKLQMYPDGQSNELRDAIAAHFGLERERLIMGCGSDEIFHLLCQTYLEAGDNIVQGEYGFGAYAFSDVGSGRVVRALLSVSRCPSCCYPLRPTTSVEPTRCAECGAAWSLPDE